MKQDNAWDIVGNSSSAADGNNGNQAKKDGAATGGNISGHRNDGTDLWKSTLSGQPPTHSKQVQPTNNPWGHTPQNPTDFRTWGEDEGEGHNPTTTGHGTVGSGAPGANQGISGTGGFGSSGNNSNFGGNNVGSGVVGPVNPPRDNYWNDNNGPSYGGNKIKYL